MFSLQDTALQKPVMSLVHLCLFQFSLNDWEVNIILYKNLHIPPLSHIFNKGNPEVKQSFTSMYFEISF